MKEYKAKYTVVNEKNQVVYVGSARDISVKYSVDRNTVYQASYGKMLIHGKYKVRVADEEERKLVYPKYYVAKPQGRPSMLLPEKTREVPVWEKDLDKPKIHIPQKYRSSSGHRFSKL